MILAQLAHFASHSVSSLALFFQEEGQTVSFSPMGLWNHMGWLAKAVAIRAGDGAYAVYQGAHAALGIFAGQFGNASANGDFTLAEDDVGIGDGVAHGVKSDAPVTVTVEWGRRAEREECIHFIL